MEPLGTSQLTVKVAVVPTDKFALYLYNLENDLSYPIKLTQNYPNPFNPVTTIGYALPNKGKVTMDVFNSLGEKISTLINEEKEPGNYTVSFNGSRYASGVYFYRVSFNGNIITKRMMMVK